jgi:hypothetical protein
VRMNLKNHKLPKNQTKKKEVFFTESEQIKKYQGISAFFKKKVLPKIKDIVYNVATRFLERNKKQIMTD